MNTKPILDDWEVPNISDIRTLENRAFVELAVPGMVGSLYQDMNTEPTRVMISGALYGAEKNSEFIETLREKYHAGTPVTFVADIVTATNLQYVVIEQLQLLESGDTPDQVHYQIVLNESPPPPPPPNPLGGIDTGLLDDATGMLDSVTGALDTISALGNIPNFGNPTEPLDNAISGVESATQGLDEMATELINLFGTRPT